MAAKNAENREREMLAECPSFSVILVFSVVQILFPG
jgi:hypothetical protein